MLIDTKREKQIGLGPDWPFEPLGAGECIISRQLADTFNNDFKVNVGDTLNM